MPPSRAAGFSPHLRMLCLPVGQRWHRSTFYWCPSQTQQLPTGLGLPALSLKLLYEWHLLVVAKTPLGEIKSCRADGKDRATREALKCIISLSSLTQVIRKFAKQLDEWLKVALHDLPENLRNIKFERKY